MFAHHKHSYLQLHTSLNPRIINRAVDNAMERFTTLNDKEPPIMRLCSEQPCIPVDKVDSTRCDKAFGRWALPKLYRELHSKLPKIQLKAVNTVGDMVHDPEQMYEAIRLGFVGRIVQLLEMELNEMNPSFAERLILVLATMATHALGREAMLDNQILPKVLFNLIQNNDENIRCKAASLCKELTVNFLGCCSLIEYGFVRLLVKRAVEEVDHIAIMHLESIERLLYDVAAQEIAFNIDALEDMVGLLDRGNDEIVTRAARCLMILVSNQQGKDLSVEMNLLIKLKNLLDSENRDVYTAAASIIMFATHTVKSKHDAAAVPGLLQRLARLANDFKHPPVQMFAMKALVNTCEHPDVRKMFEKYYLEDNIKKIITNGNEELERYKTTLIKMIEWKPWIG